MPNNYLFLDADASILTARSSITSGSAHEPFVIVTSFLSTVPTTASGNQSVSGRVDASIVGMLPAGTRVLGSVAALQGTNPWNISGSVVSQQLGTRISSVVSSTPSSLLTGIHGHRNDTVASYLGGNLSWNPLATDSAGRVVTQPFAPEESKVRGDASIVSVGSVQVLAAAGAGLRNYVTDFFISNTGATTTLVEFTDGDASVIGKTIAPTASGSNAPGLATPMRTSPNKVVNVKISSATSVLHAWVGGFKAP